MPSLRRRRAFAIDVLVIDSEEEDMESTSVKFLIDSNQAISFRETFLLALDNASSCHPLLQTRQRSDSTCSGMELELMDTFFPEVSSWLTPDLFNLINSR